MGDVPGHDNNELVPQLCLTRSYCMSLNVEILSNQVGKSG